MVNSNEMIFGVRAVLEAIEAGKEVDKILVKRDLQSELSRELFAALRGRTIPVVRVPVEKLNRITRKNHQGVIAYISAVEYASVDTLVPTLYEEGKVPFLVLLDGITDVRNFGSIARTCDCAGIDAIIIPAIFARIKVERNTGLENSSSTVPSRISRDTVLLEQSTAANNPNSIVVAIELSTTSLT